MTLKLKLNITGDNPPFEYRLVGTDVWQDSPVFEVPTLDDAGGYSVEVRDSSGCSKTFEIYEEKIALELIGGYVTPQLEVVASYGSNIDVQARINWGIGDGYPYDPADFEGVTEWTEEFAEEHRIPFPVSFTGSLHFFQATGRSRLGQMYFNSIRGIYYVPSTVEISSILYTEIEEIVISTFKQLNKQTTSISIRGVRKNKSNPEITLSAYFEASFKPTIKTNQQENIGNIHAETVIT